IVSRVPKEISAIIQRMMAKDPRERFADMGEVVRTLEAWLGVQHAGTFSPHEELIDKLEGYVLAYNTAGTAVLRGRILKGAFSASPLTAVLLLFFGKIGWASGVLGFALQSALAYFVLDGVARKGPLYARVRQFVLGLSRWDVGIGLAAVGLFGLLLG